MFLENNAKSDLIGHTVLVANKCVMGTFSISSVGCKVVNFLLCVLQVQDWVVHHHKCGAGLVDWRMLGTRPTPSQIYKGRWCTACGTWRSLTLPPLWVVHASPLFFFYVFCSLYPLGIRVSLITFSKRLLINTISSMISLVESCPVWL